MTTTNKEFIQYSRIQPQPILTNLKSRDRYPKMEENQDRNAFIAEQVAYLWGMTMVDQEMEKVFKKVENEITQEDGIKARNTLLMLLDAIGFLYNPMDLTVNESEENEESKEESKDEKKNN